MNMDPCSILVFVNFIKLKKSASHYVDYSQYFKSNFMREKYLVFLGSFKKKSRIRVLKNRHESSFIIPGWSYRAATLVQVGQKGFLKGTVSGDVYCTDEILISYVNSAKNSLAIIIHSSFLVICA